MEGIEPSSAVLEAALPPRHTPVMETGGIEPPTRRASTCRSTAELRFLVVSLEYPPWDSNPEKTSGLSRAHMPILLGGLALCWSNLSSRLEYQRWDSNPHFTAPQTVASAGWATLACNTNGGIRTLTGRYLTPVPLPIGLRWRVEQLVRARGVCLPAMPVRTQPSARGKQG